MDVLYCKIRNLTIFVIFLYFLTIVVESSGVGPSDVGPSGAGPSGVEFSGDEPTFESVDHQNCYINILKIFKVGNRYVNDRQAYLYHAILYLRHQQYGGQNVLWDCYEQTFSYTYEEFAIKYFKFIFNNSVKELPEKLKPQKYCQLDYDEEDVREDVQKAILDCKYALWYYRFEGSMESIIKQAVLNITLRDISKKLPYRGEHISFPENVYHAVTYLKEIANKLEINESTMKTPYEYCKNPV